MVMRRFSAYHYNEYQEWVRRHDTLAPSDRAAIAARVNLMPDRLISVVMPVHNTREAWLREAIESVRRQLYPHWELCIADDASTEPHVASVLAEAAKADARIRVVRRDQAGHVSAATNSALALAHGEFVAFMDHDDVLAEHALYEVAEELLAHPQADLIYSDEDQLDPAGLRTRPHFKSDWDPDLALSENIVCHLCVCRRELVERLGGLREGFEGSQDHDLVLRIADATAPDRIRHIPAILYHWRDHGSSLSKSRTDACAAAARRAIADHLQRQGVEGAEVRPFALVPSWTEVVRPCPRPEPLVSVIIPTRDRADLLSQCMDGLLARTDYPALEAIIVDNGSTDPKTLALLTRLAEDGRVRVVRDKGPFNFSALINRGASAARGDVLLLLNNDIDPIDPDWLREMVSHAMRPDVGAVGARLLYPDNSIQHAGVVLGIGLPPGVAGHFQLGASSDALGYFGRLQLARTVSAVTGACLAVRRTLFEEVGGLDATRLKVAFNDVDFCLRLRERGYRNVWTPRAQLYHHESASRGSDDKPETRNRFDREANAMRERWGELLYADPYYNLNLSLVDGNYRLGVPRRPAPWRRAPEARPARPSAAAQEPLGRLAPAGDAPPG
jgi:GT2 family glycosyltransferase